jgi:hypothetical protein
MHATTDTDYRCLDPLGGERVRVRFTGRLLGKPVTWDATLCTLASVGASRRFIDVGAATATGTRLLVGLDVPCIDAPTVLKTVIMIRGWKNLRPGRHDYGAPVGAAG